MTAGMGPAGTNVTFVRATELSYRCTAASIIRFFLLMTSSIDGPFSSVTTESIPTAAGVLIVFVPGAVRVEASRFATGSQVISWSVCGAEIDKST